MQWLEMDIRDLKFEDETFDIVIDKVSPRARMISDQGLVATIRRLIVQLDGNGDRVRWMQC